MHTNRIHEKAKVIQKLPVIIVTVLFGFMILWIDSLFDSLSVTPMLSISWLMLQSFFQRRKIIFILMMILFCFVIVSLQNHVLPFIVIRCLSFSVGGTLAILFAGSRERSDELLKTTLRIVEKLPALVVASDFNGTIISASEEICDLVKNDYSPLIGHNFSDVFMGQYSPGDAVRIYFEWLQGTRSCDGEFVIRRMKGLHIQGRLLISGHGSDLMLTAVFTPPPVKPSLA